MEKRQAQRTKQAKERKEAQERAQELAELREKLVRIDPATANIESKSLWDVMMSNADAGAMVHIEEEDWSGFEPLCVVSDDED